MDEGTGTDATGIVNCCTSGLNDVFTEDRSHKEANRYRKRGLPIRARRLVAGIESATPVKNRSVLEIGIGAGGVTVELLRRGAAKATGVDAVGAQLRVASGLAEVMGVADRLDLILADFGKVANVPPADIVVLDRVVCCYPDWRSLLTAAAARADGVLALVYPRPIWYMRAARVLINGWRRLRRTDFRFYLHPIAQMHELLGQRGLHARQIRHYFGWEILVAVRV